MSTRHTTKSMPVVLLAGFLLIAATAGAQTPLYFGCGDALPYAVDFDGDGRAELALFDSKTGALNARGLGGDNLACDLLISESGFAAAFADYDGDGLSDLGSYDHDTSVWYAFCSKTGYQLGFIQCAPGNATTEPHPADYDGDGNADPALYDTSSGLWVIYLSESGYQPISGIFGGNGMTAVPMDYDNDGKADPAVYDENSGQWWVLCSASQYALSMAALGGPGCVAAPADFDGDGKADPAVYYASLGVWGTLNSANNYELSVREQGGPDCVPVPGKYYFTNSADFAVYNPTDGTWIIAYESPLDAGSSFQDYVSAVLPSLLTGGWKGAVGGGIGWVLDLIFNHGKNPEDPHWAEMRAILSEMNGKLDQLLALSQNVLSELNRLCLQLKYESAQTRLLISELLLRQAFATVGSLYDSSGPEGYRHFYGCDTNNPPSLQTVERFTDKVLSWNMPECILKIQQTILPVLATDRSVLRQWVDLAKMRGVTPDNLMDHYRALFAYFSTLYSYQVKAGVLYADAMRQRYTNDVDRAGIQTWVTNDFQGMLQAEVDEFRAATYELVMAAVKAADIPANVANPMIVTNVAETLGVLEFFSRKWLAQPTTLCATLLAVDRQNVLSNYATVVCRDMQAQEITLQGACTNYTRGRPYGFKNPDIKNIAVNDQYVFIRRDYGRIPVLAEVYMDAKAWPVAIRDSCQIRRYDDNMQATTNVSVTNYFGHIFASPWNHELLTLPMDSSATADWVSGMHNYCHFPGLQPGNKSFRYMPWNRSWPFNGQPLNGRLYFNLEMEISYDVAGGLLPKNCGVDPWLYAYQYPFNVSNQTDRPISGVRAHVASRTYVAGQRWDSSDSSMGYTDYKTYKHHQYWEHGGGGVVWFSDGKRSFWWRQGPRELHPAGRSQRTVRDWRWSENNIVARRDSQLPPGTSVPLWLAVGARLQLLQDCYSGQSRFAFCPAYAWAWVDIYVDQIAISFY